MNLYKSELKQLPNPRSIEGINILARKRGLEVGFKFVESFILIRNLID